MTARPLCRSTRHSSTNLVFAFVVLVLCPQLAAQTAIRWDFTKGTLGWTSNRFVEEFASSLDGLTLRSTGDDPWIEGPSVDLPSSELTRVKIRMRSDADAGGELFFGRTFQAGHSIRFTVQSDGKWHDYSLVIREKVGPGTRFRLDPCTTAGDIVVASIEVESIEKISPPESVKPTRGVEGPEKAVAVKSGDIEIVHYQRNWGDFVIKVHGQEMAAGYQNEVIGILPDDEPQWLSLRNAQLDVRDERERGIICKADFKDAGGATWLMERQISAAQPGALSVEIRVTVDRDRDVISIPWLTIFPGLGTFGERKTQGLFAGLEYLSDEPSSSTADIETPEHVRRVPDPVKITFPLMAISHRGAYLGLIWEPSESAAAVFDSPDRIYGSGAHVMALSGPAVGELRFENDLCAHTPLRLRAHEMLRVKAYIIGGRGASVVDAVKHYVALKGLPPLPEFEGGFDAAVNLLAHGWLDSQIRQDGLFRHAVWGSSFGPTPAADAVMYIDWLANHSHDESLITRLLAAKQQALERIPQSDPFSSCIGHAHQPAAPLIFGRVREFVSHRENAARALLKGFDANGVQLYRPGQTDYSRTHFEKHANGYAGRDIVTILEGATFSADQGLIAEALALLDKQTGLYANTVPRGAQTWEVPLHTPDILASAHLVKAYTLGYLISGKTDYLEQARYWAWTGVPFIYLRQPTDGQVGAYATIAVLGATNWRAPVWLGQPVQWCGLVYASALHFLGQHDPQGPWLQIAKGITATGVQMSWPLTDKDRQGLLPDAFDLKAQIGAGPAINPGTVQAHLPELFDQGRVYDVERLPHRGWFIHAPCRISNINDDADAVSFTLAGWGDKSYSILITGLERPFERLTALAIPSQLPEQPAPKPVDWRFYDADKLTVVTLTGPARITIR